MGEIEVAPDELRNYSIWYLIVTNLKKYMRRRINLKISS